jgi:hypothetical protein
MRETPSGVSEKIVFTVRDMPHFAPYLQFLVNIIQIHFEHVKLGGEDYEISEAIDKQELDSLYKYLYGLQPGSIVEIDEAEARVLYAAFVIVSRLIICEYGEEICGRLIRNLPPKHRWHNFENFRADLLHHNTQMLMDMEQNMIDKIPYLDEVKERVAAVTLL